ncbi:MAG: hypothetical protein NTV97_11385 [Alphaproteobacteria bacterium]|nr:hypothetical protein [Alphaproteobacteria bacterium]
MTPPDPAREEWRDRLSSKAHSALADQLLEHLAGLAEFGLACPTAEVLALTLRCNASSIAGLFRKLIDRGQVLVEMKRRPVGQGRSNYFRRVTIVATGRRTAAAMPRAVEPDAEAQRLERAITFLRSRGPTVYVDGPVVHVDRRMMPAQEVIRLAVRQGFESCAPETPPPAPTPYAAHYGGSRQRSWRGRAAGTVARAGSPHGAEQIEVLP